MDNTKLKGKTSSQELLFIEHDGAIDDLLSLMLVLTIKNIELIGINITPADCFIEPAVESTYKILHLFDKSNVPIGRSKYSGINSFPGAWRARPKVINALPAFINLPKGPDPYAIPEACNLFIEQLEKADKPVHVLITGPCSNIVKALEINPAIGEKIKQVVWMGGAFKVPGNVQTYQHNGSAEWNSFWDPVSSKKLFELELPLICVPLDITNHFPVSLEFLSKLAGQRHILSSLAGQFWALTIDSIPSYHYIYCMWDVLAASFMAIPEKFTLKEIRAKISDRTPNAGQTVLDDNGHKLKVITHVNIKLFYKFLLDQFNREIINQSQ